MMSFINFYTKIINMEYNNQVRELLESYHDKIETEIMPQLTKEYTTFYVGVTELCGKLKNKGLLKEDPYFKGSEIIELTIPSTEQFPESDAQWKVAERVTHYESILSFITHNYNFSLNTFNFTELEKMKQFLDYYDWKGLLNPSTPDYNTQTFGKIALTYRNSSNDSLVLNTFDKCLESIIKSVEAILNKLKIILIYLKESYKLFIRMDILPIVKEKNPDAPESKILSLISNEIKENYSYLKLYKKYINEVINEEYSSEAEELKGIVIKKLTVTKKVKVEKEKKVDNTKDLIHLLMEIGKIRIHLAASIDKLFLNHNNLKENEGSFISKLFKKLSNLLFNITPKTIYQLKLKNKNGSTKPLTLHFEKFYQDIKKLEYDLLNFAEEDKTIIYIKNNNNNVNQSVDRLLMTIKKHVSIFIALDEYLKVEMRKNNLKAKGIKPELTVIKTLINSSTSMYREYLDAIDGK